MADDRELEIWKNLREAQDKHAYFILAAAGSALAFAVHITIGRSLAWSMLPLGVAAACWAFSFWAGGRLIAYLNSTVYANIALLQVKRGTHPDLRYRGNPEEIAIASAGITAAVESNSRMVERWGNWQTQLLVAGALAFIFWHVLEMALKR